METVKHKALSASKIKTYESCSWLYWCNYHLKLPQIQNTGAKKGNVCHTVFEMLLNKRHAHWFKVIVDAKSITASKSITRMVKRALKKAGLTDPAEFSHVDKMILVGLNADFYVKGAVLKEPELKFEILNEEPAYLIKGFIDRPSVKKGTILIDDFKSSKKQFTGEDLVSNLQGLMYSLAAKKLWPKLKAVVRFIFLQFPENPIQKLEFSDDALSGFEHYLAELQTRVDSFDLTSAKKRYAADKTPKGDEFAGKLMCGFASKKGQLKKDNTPMWHCQYKFGYKYFILKDKNGEIISTSFANDFQNKPNGSVVEEAEYLGCPKHINPIHETKYQSVADIQI